MHLGGQLPQGCKVHVALWKKSKEAVVKATAQTAIEAVAKPVAKATEKTNSQ